LISAPGGLGPHRGLKTITTQVVEPVSDGFQIVVEQVGIDVECDRRVCMAKHPGQRQASRVAPAQIPASGTTAVGQAEQHTDRPAQDADEHADQAAAGGGLASSASNPSPMCRAQDAQRLVRLAVIVERNDDDVVQVGHDDHLRN
jgi:hypothetical protein